MKNLFIFSAVLLLLAPNLFSQYSTGQSAPYIGFGFSFAFFTNPTVYDYYPTVSSQNSQFLVDLDLSFGYNYKNKLNIEFAPSFMFTPSPYNYGGYYWFGPWPYYSVNNKILSSVPDSKAAPVVGSSDIYSGNYYYDPDKMTLFCLPLNVKLKYFPFNKSMRTFADGLFASLSLGAMYIYEKHTGYYKTSTSPVQYSYNISNSTWRPNASVGIGYNYIGDINFGGELSYKFVPLPVDRKTPLVINNAGNMNTIVLTFGIGYNFY